MERTKQIDYARADLHAFDPETYTASIRMELWNWPSRAGLGRPMTVSHVSVDVIGDVACTQARERPTDFVCDIVTTTIHIPNGEGRFGEPLRTWKGQ